MICRSERVDLRLKFVYFIILALGLVACTSGDEQFSKILAKDESTNDFGQIGNSALTITPLSYAFGPVPINTSSTAKEIVIKNSAGSTVFLKSIISVSSHFTTTSSDCPLATEVGLAPETSCSVNVIFSPTQSGEFSTSLGVSFGKTAGSGEYTTYAALEGIGTSTLIFAGLDAIDLVRSTSLRLNWTDVGNENGYAYFRVNSGTLEFLGSVPKNTTSVAITGLSPGTAYSFRVRALDFYGNYETNTVDRTVTTNQAVQLTNVEDRTFRTFSGPLLASSSFAIDINNISGGANNDSGMTYTCFFDSVVNGTVDSSNACSASADFSVPSSFAGVAGSTDGNGQFYFIPSSSLIGKTVEIKVTGSDGGTSASEIILVNVIGSYKRTNLVLDYQADFARETSPGTNSPFASTWVNLLPSTTGLDGLTSSGTWSTGWLGDGTWPTNPFRLSFAGVSGASADRVVSGTSLNSLSTPFFTAWLKPKNLSAGSVQQVFGNGGNGSSGWSLLQTAAGNLAFSVGNTVPTTSDTIISSLSPAVYYKMNETSGTAVADSGTSGNNGTLQTAGSVSLNQTGAFTGSTSFRFTGNGYLQPNAGININTTWSISVFVRMPLPSNGVWKTVTRGTIDHQMIFQDSTNILGSYDNATGFRGTGFDTDTLSAGWHHFAAVANGTTTTFYVNGTSVGSIPWVSSSDILAIGNYQAGGQPAYDIDDFALFHVALTPTQINQIVTGGCLTAVSQDAWTHIAGLFNGTSLTLLKNGSSVCTQTVSGSVTGSVNSFTLGAKSDGTMAWNGELAQLQVYNTGIAADALTNYNAGFQEYRNPSSCQEWYSRGFTTSGTYTINITGIGDTSVYCDQSTDGGGWMLVLNYLHQGGTNPATNPRTTSLPLIVSSTLGTDESGNSTAWGHAAPALLSLLSFTEQRFSCQTSGHGRVMNFKSSNAACISYFRVGTSGSCTGINTGYTYLTGHTSVVPPTLDGYFSAQGNDAMTSFPFYRGGANHWGIRGQGSRWECDDFAGGSGNNTLHRIWVR